MPAPTFGDSYLTMPAGTAPNPGNAAESLPQLDPAFITAWKKEQYDIPGASEGDPAFIMAVADIAYAYHSGNAPLALTTISPTTTPHGVAFTITATGTGFDGAAFIVVGGVICRVTSATITQLTATVPASAIPTAGTYQVGVSDEGVQTSTQPLTVT